jgi:hypothetical protein
LLKEKGFIMTVELPVDIAVEEVEKPVAKKAPAKKSTAKKTTATEKVAEELPIVMESVTLEEVVVNDDGEKVITGPSKPEKAPRSSNSRVNEDGVVTVNSADAALRKKVDTTVNEAEATPDEKVAIWSARNMRWSDVGSVSQGYNIVTKEAAVKWLGRQGVRMASADELSTYYSK